MSVLPVGISGEAGAYQIERSLRFNSADSAYLNRTPASAGNRKTWTWSGWVKRSGINIGSRQTILSCSTGGTTFNLYLDYSSAKLDMHSVGNIFMSTNQEFRDASAWYHIVFAVDTTQATSSNRWKLYVNGVEVTSFATASYPNQNTDLEINSTAAHNIGRNTEFSTYHYSGYMAEVHFIDGSALTPSDFGEFNTDTGVWQPKAYSGSYGTNGFYLDFADNSSTTALGYDAAGSNDWTPNNFSVTAGAGNDSLVDTPTPYGTDTGVGAEVRGNYATLNKLSQLSTSTTISNGNLSAVIPASSVTGTGVGTIAVSSGKWYWETTYTTSTGNYLYVGIGNPSNISPRWLVRGSDGEVFGPTTSGSATAIRFVQGDVIGIALDSDNGKWFIRVNGTWQLSADPVAGTGFVHSGLYGDLAPRYENATSGGSQTIDINFGQRPFAYTAPSGFKALCTTNLPDPAIADGSTAMNAVLYTGTGSSQSITGVGFQPDLVWAKGRSAAFDNNLYDAVRGASKRLESNTTSAEVTYSGVTSFNSDGFTVEQNQVNNSGTTYVAWNWKANGAGVSNTDGSITSTVSANTTSGVSVVTYTGTGANATVGHGLSSAPSMVIVKRRNSTGNWFTQHTSLSSSANIVYLNLTDAQAASASIFNSTFPTSTVFSLGSGNSNVSGGTYVAYCFAPVEGFSAFGSYTGNGSTDGPFVYTGFKPRWVMIKNTSQTASWYLLDTARNTYNVMNAALFPNLSNAENTSDNILDCTSNGFKLRASGTAVNYSGNTFVYAAFAENPFKYALAR